MLALIVAIVEYDVTQTFKWKTAREHLPQGSPLLLCLYNVFVGDITQLRADPRSHLFQFADDTAIVAASNALEGARVKLT